MHICDYHGIFLQTTAMGILNVRKHDQMVEFLYIQVTSSENINIVL